MKKGFLFFSVSFYVYRLVIYLAFLVLWPSLCFSQTYYVDASLGDDNNDGLSPSKAWRTINKARLAISDIPQGSDILFKRGETFTGAHLYIKRGGTSENPMVIGAYGSGEKPIFDSNAKVLGTDSNLGYIHVQDIRFTNSGTGAAVMFIGDSGHDLTISRIDVIDSGQNAVHLASVDGYLIEDCYIRNCALGGLVIYGSDRYDSKVQNGVIRNCDIEGIGSDGITIHKSDGLHNDVGPNHLLINNKIGYCGENAYDITSGSNITILNAEAYESSQTDFLIGHGATNVWIDKAYVHGGRFGIYINPSARVKVTNSIIENSDYHSLFVGDDSGNQNSVSDIEIYNNLIVHSDDSSAFDVASGTQGLKFKNNIVYLKNGSFFRWLHGASYENTSSNFDSNIWFRPGGSSFQIGQRSYNVDPEFVNLEGGDYQLKQGSPAIDIGIDVGLEHDFLDNPRPLGAGFDLGPFEFGETSVFYGDVSENGTISAYDASLTAQHAVGIMTLTPEQQTKADVSGEGTVSAFDASWIARKVVDESVVFPVEE